jgi:hypothetical protein
MGDVDEGDDCMSLGMQLLLLGKKSSYTEDFLHIKFCLSCDITTKNLCNLFGLTITIHIPPYQDSYSSIEYESNLLAKIHLLY